VARAVALPGRGTRPSAKAESKATAGLERYRATPAGTDAGAKKASSGVVGTTKVTHPERIIDSSTGLTKIDLVRYYESIANWMVPHLKGRACSLLRGPSGIDGQLFFQKHLDRLRIPGIKALDPALFPGHEALLEVPSAAAIAAAAQMNVIEFHTWNSQVRNIDKPDRIVFDLDPGEGVSWQRVQEGAALTRSLLQQLGLEAWLKTSGGKGLHIIVPIAQPVPLLLSALGPRLLRLAGEVADGTLLWMTGPKTVANHVAPRINKAAADVGRDAPQIVAALPIAVTNDVEAAKQDAAKTLEIYGGLPSYRAMLDAEGAAGPGDVAPEVRR